jgi:hypothetical protein
MRRSPAERQSRPVITSPKPRHDRHDREAPDNSTRAAKIHLARHR